VFFELFRNNHFSHRIPNQISFSLQEEVPKV